MLRAIASGLLFLQELAHGRQLFPLVVLRVTDGFIFCCNSRVVKLHALCFAHCPILAHERPPQTSSVLGAGAPLLFFNVLAFAMMNCSRPMLQDIFCCISSALLCLFSGDKHLNAVFYDLLTLQQHVCADCLHLRSGCLPLEPIVSARLRGHTFIWHCVHPLDASNASQRGCCSF